MADSDAPDQGSGQIAADEALLEALRIEDFQGPAWDRFAGALAGYGLPIIGTWIASLKIFTECARKGVRCLGPPHGSQRLSDDDAHEMANETVARAINKFRDKVLRPGVWSSQGKASLTTMFITQCIYQFPNVYRHWLLETKQPLMDDLEELEFLEARPGGDPAGLVMIRDEVTHALEHYVRDERVRRGLVLQVMGYTAKESAEMMDITAKALESAVQRHRRTLPARPGNGEGESAP